MSGIKHCEDKTEGEKMRERTEPFPGWNREFALVTENSFLVYGKNKWLNSRRTSNDLFIMMYAIKILS